MSYIIKNGQIAAVTSGTFASGKSVSFSARRTAESLDANREFNLVNASTGKISNAKKWDAEFARMAECMSAVEINGAGSRQFYLS